MRLERRVFGSLICAALLIVACTKKEESASSSGGAPTDGGVAQGKGVRAADFDRSCTRDEECIVVSEGTACCLACPSTAIAKKGFAAYNTKLAEHRASCKQASCAKAECPNTRGRCNAGTCELCAESACPPSGDASVDSGPPPDGKLIELPGPNGSFDPGSVEIKANDTVTWIFYEDGHSVVSGTGCSDDGKFTGSGPKGSGGAHSFTFTAAGDFPYHCEAHCGKESGIIRVK